MKKLLYSLFIIHCLFVGGLYADEEYTGPLPVRLADANLEKMVRSGAANSPVTMANLESCSMIFVNGEFEWGPSDVGYSANQTCVAKVRMQAATPGASPNPLTDKVVAIAMVPAGASINCNIGDFPASGYQPAAGDVIFPADKAPTIEEVTAVMNNEQKQNAGIKAVTAALVGGAGAFLAADDTAGAKKAAIVAGGAAAAGGLAFASTQAGKIAGDTIMSVGVNAAAGAVVGNMGAGMGGGNSILVVKDCKGGDDNRAGFNGQCLWGYVTTGGKPFFEGGWKSCYWSPRTESVLCTKVDEGSNDAEYEPAYGFFKIKVDLGDADKIVNEKYKDANGVEQSLTNADYDKCFVKNADGKWNAFDDSGGAQNCTPEQKFIQIVSASTNGTRRLAMMKDIGVRQKPGGLTMSDWNDNKAAFGTMLVGRNADGSENNDATHYADFADIENFKPLTIDASDGDIIDFGNRARDKGTAIGAAAGAGLGGLAAYQGAKSEIEERWIVEVENYEGSLRGFYCITGNRFLGAYNSMVVIPGMK